MQASTKFRCRAAGGGLRCATGKHPVSQWAACLLGAGDRYEESVTTTHGNRVCGSFDRSNRPARIMGAAGARPKTAAARWVPGGAVGEGFELHGEPHGDQ